MQNVWNRRVRGITDTCDVACALLSHAQHYIIDLFDKVQVGANVYVVP